MKSTNTVMPSKSNRRKVLGVFCTILCLLWVSAGGTASAGDLLDVKKSGVISPGKRPCQGGYRGQQNLPSFRGDRKTWIFDSHLSESGLADSEGGFADQTHGVLDVMEERQAGKIIAHVDPDLADLIPGYLANRKLGIVYD